MNRSPGSVTLRSSNAPTPGMTVTVADYSCLAQGRSFSCRISPIAPALGVQTAVFSFAEGRRPEEVSHLLKVKQLAELEFKTRLVWGNFRT